MFRSRRTYRRYKGLEFVEPQGTKRGATVRGYTMIIAFGVVGLVLMAAYAALECLR